MNRRRALPLAVVTALVLAAAGWYLLHGNGRPSPLVLQGNVDVRQAELAFKEGGRIAAMCVQEGDSVKAGQVLAELERHDFEADLQQAHGQVLAQTAQLAELRNGSRPEEIDQARAQVADGEATLINAQLTFKRQQELLKNDITSRSNFDQASAELHQAEARLANAKAALVLAVKGPRQERIDAAGGQLQQARAAERLAEQRVTDATLVAPDDGVILSRVREPGTIVGVGEAVYTIVFTHPTWVRAYVAEPSLGRVHPGMRVEVMTDSGQRYQGQVGYISPMAEFTPKTVQTPEQRAELVYRLRVIVSGADTALRQGMPVTVQVPDEQGR
jgi:HlyD family secretion protein